MDTEITVDTVDDRAGRPAHYVEVYDDAYRELNRYGPYASSHRAALVESNVRHAAWFIP